MSKKKLLAVVLGGSVNGYSVTRSLNETYDIKSIIIDYKKHFTFHSDISDYIYVPDPKTNQDTFIKRLYELDEMYGGYDKTIFATSDDFLIPLLKNRDALEKHYIFPFSNWGVINKLIIKDRLYDMCDKLDIKYPRTQKIVKIKNLDLEEIKFPALVKPVNVTDFSIFFKGEKKNNIFHNKEKLLRYLKEKLTIKEFKTGFIVQDYIEGGTENLYTITTYTDKNFDIKGASIGHKLTQHPPDAGTIRSGYVTWKDGLFEQTQKLFKEVEFYGVANTEYKLDPKTGEFYMMEVNPRPGFWNYSAYATGVDLFGMSIKEHVFGEEINFQRSQKNIVWLIENRTRILRKIKNTPVYETIKNVDKQKFIDPRINPNENLKYNTYLFWYRLRGMMINLLLDMKIKERLNRYRRS